MIVPGGAITPDLLSGDYRHGDALTGKRRLQRVDMPGTSTALATFSYDLAGRLTRVGLGGATDTTMVFDAFDRVREVDAPGHGLIRHRYDASGERATTLSPGPAGGLVERFFGGGLTQREGRLELHVGLGGARVVARLNVPELPDGTPALGDNLGGAPVIVYLHQGVGHGPTVMTDGAGALLEERHHEPYGTPLWADADYELERLGWNGKLVDPLTGWSDHGARWHGTRFARWLSVDPPLKGPGGLVEHGLMATPYGFVAGNPVLFWDPDGRDWRLEPNERAFRNRLTRDAYIARYNVSESDARTAAQLGSMEAFASDNATWHGSDPLNGVDHNRAWLLDHGLLQCDDDNRCRSVVMDSEDGQRVLNDPNLRAIYEESRAATTGQMFIGKLVNFGLMVSGARVPIGSPVRAVIASTGPSSKALGRALEAAGFVRPARSVAHHIVAGRAAGAAPARAVLKRFGIEIDDAANGVFLPADKRAPNPTGAAVHSKVHTRVYYQRVNDMLLAATTRAEAVQALEVIRKSLLSGGL